LEQLEQLDLSQPHNNAELFSSSECAAIAPTGPSISACSARAIGCASLCVLLASAGIGEPFEDLLGLEMSRSSLGWRALDGRATVGHVALLARASRHHLVMSMELSQFASRSTDRSANFGFYRTGDVASWYSCEIVLVKRETLC
jgi:hypothetical protein